MKTVFKYPIKGTPKEEIDLPHGAQLLTARYRGSQLFIWARVDPQAENEKRDIYVVGTGEAIEVSGLYYVATVERPNTSFIHHIFSK